MFWGAIIGAVVGAVIEGVAQKMRGEPLDWGKIGRAALVGAVTGLVGGFVAGALLKAGGVATATGARAVATKVVAHSAGGATAGATDRVINNAIDGRPLGEGVGTSAALGAGVGAVTVPLAGPVQRLGDRVAGAFRKAPPGSGASRATTTALEETPPGPGPPKSVDAPDPPPPAPVEPPPPPEPSKGLVQALDLDAPPGAPPPTPKARAPPRPEKLRLSHKGRSEPVALTQEELRSIRSWEEWLGRYWDRWQSTAIDHLPERTQQLLRGKTDDAITKGLTPDDLAAVLKENRGVQIPRGDGTLHNHLKEALDNLQSIQNTQQAISERLAWLARTGKAVPGEVELLQAKAADLAEALGRYARPDPARAAAIQQANAAARQGS